MGIKSSRKLENKTSHIHLIGIGGISMSAIAEVLKKEGHKVTGSDENSGEQTDILTSKGIPVKIGIDLDNAKAADLIIYTGGVREDHPERQYIKKSGKKALERADFMEILTQQYKNCIGISGTHGKTTTTSMVSVCFLEADKDPSIQVGGYLSNIGANYRAGGDEYLIIESCEYKDSFLKFHPTTAVVLNIDLDHIDYFKNLEAMKKSFKTFMEKPDETGYVVLNGDDENIQDILEKQKEEKTIKGKIITYGKNKENDYYYANIENYHINDHEEGCKFEVFEKEKSLGFFELNITGEYNVSNATATIAISRIHGLEIEEIRNGLKEFKGTHRRFEFIGAEDGVRVYDDYAHHPTEIKALAEAVAKLEKNESYGIFQSHTYTRTAKFLKEFADSLMNFDHIYIAPTFAAREKNTTGIDIEDLKEEILKLDKNKDVKCIYEFDDIAEEILKNVKEDDVVFTIGAGKANLLGPQILEKLKNRK